MYWVLSSLLSSSQVAESQCTWLSDITRHIILRALTIATELDVNEKVCNMIWSYYRQETLSTNTKLKHSTHIFSHFIVLTHYFEACGKKKKKSQLFIDTASKHLIWIQMQSKAKYLQCASPKYMFMANYLLSVSNYMVLPSQSDFCWPKRNTLKFYAIYIY